jgi:hypothetical protein
MWECVDGLVLYPGGLKYGMLVVGRSRRQNVEVPGELRIGVAFEK